MLEQEGFNQIVFVGDATAKYQGMVAPTNRLISSVDLPSAKYLANLAQLAYEQEQFVDVAYFEPFYLKKPNITKPKPKF